MWATLTRPDISAAVSRVAQFTAAPIWALESWHPDSPLPDSLENPRPGLQWPLYPINASLRLR